MSAGSWVYEPEPYLTGPHRNSVENKRKKKLSPGMPSWVELTEMFYVPRIGHWCAALGG